MALVEANDYVAVVEINKGTFTGAFMVHDKVKVLAELKGKLGTTVLFSSINADKNALPPVIEPPKNRLPILTLGTYFAVVEAHEITNSFSDIKVPFFGRVGKPPEISTISSFKIIMIIVHGLLITTKQITFAHSQGKVPDLFSSYEEIIKR